MVCITFNSFFSLKNYFIYEGFKKISIWILILLGRIIIFLTIKRIIVSTLHSILNYAIREKKSRILTKSLHKQIDQNNDQNLEIHRNDTTRTI
jgi:hypothetical protein